MKPLLTSQNPSISEDPIYQTETIDAKQEHPPAAVRNRQRTVTKSYSMQCQTRPNTELQRDPPNIQLALKNVNLISINILISGSVPTVAAL